MRIAEDQNEKMGSSSIASRRRALRILAAAPGALLVSRARAEGAARQMTQRPIPASGERLPVIGLGTWQTFDVGADAAARAPLREVLAELVAGGGKIVDSSPMYGSSEAVVGDLVAALGIRAKTFIATKVWTSGREAGIREMQRSFQRLRVERMDLMQIHNLLDVAVHTETLRQWKQEGRVRYIGITHYAASAYPEVERWLATGQYDFLQINYSLAERSAERRVLPLAQAKRAAVIVNRPFGTGSLFSAVRGKPLPPWAAELGIASWAQFFLKWILGHPAVCCAIPATDKPAHMLDNLAAGYGPLPDAAQRDRMAEYFESL
jgi:diketogulonate reductase-like aldo/keto reductase